MKKRSENSKSGNRPAKIGLLGGTFDPIHFGHLHLAIELKERCELDQVWLIPAACSPFREKGVSVSSEHRLKMVELAIEGIHGFKVIDYEIRQGGISYTIDTLKNLIKSFPHEAFSLLLGDDVAVSFHLWKQAEEIAQLLPILVGKRRGWDVKNILENSLASSELKKVLINGFVDMPYVEIEASSIRKRIQQKLYCNHLIPAKVLDYIYQNQLYFNG